MGIDPETKRYGEIRAALTLSRWGNRFQDTSAANLSHQRAENPLFLQGITQCRAFVTRVT